MMFVRLVISFVLAMKIECCYKSWCTRVRRHWSCT